MTSPAMASGQGVDKSCSPFSHGSGSMEGGVLALLTPWPLDLPESMVPRWHLSQGLMGFVVPPLPGADPGRPGHPE